MRKKLLIFAAVVLTALQGLAQGWPAQYEGVMLQGFGWGSYSYTSWSQFTEKADELSSYFDLIWVPQSGMTRPWWGYCYDRANKSANGYGLSNDEMIEAERELREHGVYLGTYWNTMNLSHQDDIFDMGYMCWKWFDQNSRFGTEAELRQMIDTYKSKGTGIIEDVVINHKLAEGNNGLVYSNEEYVGQRTNVTYRTTWDNTNFTHIPSNDSPTGGGGAAEAHDDYEQDITYCSDLDHSKPFVRENVKTYLDFLRNEIGYTGFRFDAAKGFRSKYLAEYLDHSRPTYAVGEIWDSQSRINEFYSQNSSNTEPTCAAFDFPLKFAINNAFNNGTVDWTYLNGVGTCSDWKLKRYAITFVDNHDTRREYWANYPCNSNYREAANAFILMMPGTPSILYDDYLAYTTDIQNLIKIRHTAGIHNQSGIEEVVKWNNKNGVQFRISGKHGEVWINLGDAADRQYAHTGFTEAYLKQGKYFIEYTTGLDWTTQSGRVPVTNGYAVIDKNSGNYTNSVTVNIKPSNPECTLVYTTNGVTPDAGCRRVSDAVNGVNVTIDKTTTLKVGVLVKGAVIDGTVVTRDYVVNTAEQGNNVKVYLKVQGATSSNMPYIYAWTKDNNGNTTYENATFPGWGIYGFTETIGGVEWYAAEIPVEECNLIFSWGTNATQTADINNVRGTVFYTFEYGMAYDLTSQYINDIKDPKVSIESPSGEYIGTVTTALTPSFENGIIVYTTDNSTPSATTTWDSTDKCYKATATGTSVVSEGACDVTLYYHNGDAQVLRAAIVNPQDGRLVNNVARSYWIKEATGGTGNTAIVNWVEENIPTSGTNVYVKKSTYTGSGSLHVHAWTNATPSTNITSWPGYEFTSDDIRKVNNVEYYYHHFTQSDISVQFNTGDNSHQAEQSLPLAGSYYFEYTGTNTTATDISQSSGNVTVNSSSSSSPLFSDQSSKLYILVRSTPDENAAPYLHTWGGTPETSSPVRLTQSIEYNGHKYWYMAFSSEPTGFLFCNTSGYQYQTNDIISGFGSSGVYCYWYYRDTSNKGNRYGADSGTHTPTVTTTTTTRTNNVSKQYYKTVTADPINIYVEASSAPYLYAYYDGTDYNSAWHGTQMNVTRTVNGKTWWYKQFDNNLVEMNIIFNDGGSNQSSTFTVTPGDNYFTYNGSTQAAKVSGLEETSALPSCVLPMTGDLHYCYFENNRDYYSPYIYLWNTNSETIVGAWPGEELLELVGTSPDGNAIYRWTYTGRLTPTNLNFSERGTDDSNDATNPFWYKTHDFEFVDGGYYNCSGLVGIASGSVWKLADVIRKAETGTKYIIDNDLYVGYYSPTRNSLFVRDADGEAVDYDYPEPGEEIYTRTPYIESLGIAPYNVEQANWLEITFTDNSHASQEALRNLVGRVVMGQTLYGTYDNAVNPHMTTDYKPLDLTAVTPPELEHNKYVPINFLAKAKRGHYFYVDPKPQEYMELYGIIYKNGMFYVDPRNDLGADSETGIAIDATTYWASEDGRSFDQVIANLNTAAGEGLYGVKAIVKVNGSGSSSAPAVGGRTTKDAPATPTYSLNLISGIADPETHDVVTAIDTPKEVVSKTVKNVVYYDTMGRRSSKPFKGVNIVVTTFTDGSEATAKIVREPTHKIGHIITFRYPPRANPPGG